MTTTTITNEQIELLLNEARYAGDEDQVAVCEFALGRGPADGSPVRGLRGALWTGDEARAECARVVADATAQAR